jgi:Oxoglutarate and iron-dependent oxygenase degradation C-term
LHSSTEYESHGILPDTVATLKSLLCSEAFTEYLADVTGMTFTAVTCEVRAFAHGDYSMLCDPQYKQSLRESKSKRVLGKAGLSAADGDDNDGDGKQGIHLLTWLFSLV